LTSQIAFLHLEGFIQRGRQTQKLQTDLQSSAKVVAEKIASESLTAWMDPLEHWVLHSGQRTQRRQSQIQALLEVLDVADLLLSVLVLPPMVTPGRWIPEPGL